MSVVVRSALQLLPQHTSTLDLEELGNQTSNLPLDRLPALPEALALKCDPNSEPPCRFPPPLFSTTTGYFLHHDPQGLCVADNHPAMRDGCLYHGSGKEEAPRSTSVWARD